MLNEFVECRLERIINKKGQKCVRLHDSYDYNSYADFLLHDFTVSNIRNVFSFYMVEDNELVICKWCLDGYKILYKLSIHEIESEEDIIEYLTGSYPDMGLDMFYYCLGFIEHEKNV